MERHDIPTIGTRTDKSRFIANLIREELETLFDRYGHNPELVIVLIDACREIMLVNGVAEMDLICGCNNKIGSILECKHCKEKKSRGKTGE